MPEAFTDYPQVQQADIETTDAAGATVAGSVVLIPVAIPSEDVDDWLAAYDSANQYSPSTADSRVIARAVLDALQRAKG